MNVDTYVCVQDCVNDFDSLFELVNIIDISRVLCAIISSLNRDVHMVKMISIPIKTNDQIIPLPSLKNPNERLRKRCSNDCKQLHKNV